MVQFCLKLFYLCSKIKNKCVRLQMAGIRIDCNLKRLGNVFKFIALALGKLAKTQIMAYSLFKNALDIFLLVFYNHFQYDKNSFSKCSWHSSLVSVTTETTGLLKMTIMLFIIKRFQLTMSDAIIIAIILRHEGVVGTVNKFYKNGHFCMQGNVFIKKVIFDMCRKGNTKRKTYRISSFSLWKLHRFATTHITHMPCCINYVLFSLFPVKKGKTVNSLLSDHPWCRKKWSLKRKINLKQYLTEKQNGYLQSGRLRQWSLREIWLYGN